MTPPSKETLDEKINRLKEQFYLTDCAFDIECIYQPGDLAGLLQGALSRLLPNNPVEIVEKLSADQQQYVATVSSNDQPLLDLFADTHADFLPDNFPSLFESLPERLGTEKRFYLLHPMLTGQVVWYFCGRPDELEQARSAGLPLMLPGEDLYSQDVSEYL